MEKSLGMQNGLRVSRGVSVGAALARATARLTSAGVDTARLDAECLLASLLGCDRLHLYAGPAARPGVLEAYEVLLRRREAREPLAYLTGEKEFWSLPFRVSPAVLIPRPDTETLVEAAFARLAPLSTPVVADVGTGSGAIAVALARMLPRARIFATDVSGAALAVARENVGAHDVHPQVLLVSGDLLRPLFAGGLSAQCDLVVSNPPYVAAGEVATLPPEVRYEPPEALDGGPDGLDFHRRIIADAPALLKAGGWLAVEMAPGQREALVELLRSRGVFVEIEVVPDWGGRDRVIVARLGG